MRVTISVTRPATLIQAEPDRVEIGVAPERGAGRQAAEADRETGAFRLSLLGASRWRL